MDTRHWGSWERSDIVWDVARLARSVNATLESTGCFTCWGKKDKIRGHSSGMAAFSGSNSRGTILMVKGFNPTKDAEKLKTYMDGTGECKLTIFFYSFLYSQS